MLITLREEEILRSCDEHFLTRRAVVDLIKMQQEKSGVSFFEQTDKNNAAAMEGLFY